MAYPDVGGVRTVPILDLVPELVQRGQVEGGLHLVTRASHHPGATRALAALLVAHGRLATGQCRAAHVAAASPAKEADGLVSTVLLIFMYVLGRSARCHLNLGDSITYWSDVSLIGVIASLIEMMLSVHWNDIKVAARAQHREMTLSLIGVIASFLIIQLKWFSEDWNDTKVVNKK